MFKMKAGCTLSVLLVILYLTACSVNNDRMGASRYWGNHKCVAVNQTTHQSYQGWSTNEDDAKTSAVHKCDAGAREGEGCAVTMCQ